MEDFNYFELEEKFAKYVVDDCKICDSKEEAIRLYREALSYSSVVENIVDEIIFLKEVEKI